jgi:hypothetical protein
MNDFGTCLDLWVLSKPIWLILLLVDLCPRAISDAVLSMVHSNRELFTSAAGKISVRSRDAVSQNAVCVPPHRDAKSRMDLCFSGVPFSCAFHLQPNILFLQISESG